MPLPQRFMACDALCTPRRELRYRSLAPDPTELLPCSTAGGWTDCLSPSQGCSGQRFDQPSLPGSAWHSGPGATEAENMISPRKAGLGPQLCGSQVPVQLTSLYLLLFLCSNSDFVLVPLPKPCRGLYAWPQSEGHPQYPPSTSVNRGPLGIRASEKAETPAQ